MGGERNPAIDKYAGAGGMPKNPYLKEGVIPTLSRYGFDIISLPRSYFGDPGSRYRSAYPSR